jgi:hypothetical protein
MRWATDREYIVIANVSDCLLNLYIIIMESQIKIFNAVRDLIIRHNLTKDELNSYFDFK